MTLEIFQTKHAPEVKKFLESDHGKAYLSMINAMRPSYEFPVHEHLMMANREAIRGYEMCMRNMIGVVLPQPQARTVEANYGVKQPEKTEEKK